MESFIVAILYGVLVGGICALFFICFDVLSEMMEEKKKAKKSKSGAGLIYEYTKNHCVYEKKDDIIKNLCKFKDRMEALETDKDLKGKLKPYDRFCKNLISGSLSYEQFYIVIDKNLKPRFAPNSVIRYLDFESDKKLWDKEIEQCFDTNELENFIEECKNAKDETEKDENRVATIESKLISMNPPK